MLQIIFNIYNAVLVTHSTVKIYKDFTQSVTVEFIEVILLQVLIFCYTNKYYFTISNKVPRLNFRCSKN